MKYEKLSPYKRNKLKGIIVNVAVVIVSYVLIKLEWLSILPVFLLAGSTLMAGVYALYFFCNYDDQEDSLESFFQNSMYITSHRKQPEDGQEKRHD